MFCPRINSIHPQSNLVSSLKSNYNIWESFLLTIIQTNDTVIWHSPPIKCNDNTINIKDLSQTIMHTRFYISCNILIPWKGIMFMIIIQRHESSYYIDTLRKLIGKKIQNTQGCIFLHEIRGRYHCLFKKGFGPLHKVMEYEEDCYDFYC